jgi:hypothetical protein
MNSESYTKLFSDIDTAASPATPPERLAKLSEHPHRNVRTAVAANQRTPEAIQDRLSGDPYFGVRMQVAQTTKNTVILDRLSRDRSQNVRREVCANPHITEEIAEKLASSRNEFTRGMAAQLSLISASTLMRLAADSDQVCCLLARNPNLPAEIIEILLSNPNPAIRLELLSCVNLTTAQRAMLWLDPDEAVSAAARSSD